MPDELLESRQDAMEAFQAAEQSRDRDKAARRQFSCHRYFARNTRKMRQRGELSRQKCRLKKAPKFYRDEKS
ncbi:MAG: hypothetical protein Q7T63_13530 [Burkholderiaceae bacterium]|nr:hypothetical protein [Burkholderiaceae bacterium]MDO9030918.1 hypothetical protein [Hydrogenophaga sp.]